MITSIFAKRNKSEDMASIALEVNENFSETLNYDQAMNELITLVKKWESSQPDLSQAAPDLERAAFLVKFCREYLRTVEQKVEEVGM